MSVENRFIVGGRFRFLGNLHINPVDVVLRVNKDGHALFWQRFDDSTPRVGKYLSIDDITDCRLMVDGGVGPSARMRVVANKDFSHHAFFDFYPVGGGGGDEVEPIRAWSQFLFELVHTSKRNSGSVLRLVERLFAPATLHDRCGSTWENAYAFSPLEENSILEKMNFAEGSDGDVMKNGPFDPLRYYLGRVKRPELMEIFNQLSQHLTSHSRIFRRPTLLLLFRSMGKSHLPPEEFRSFINTMQRDPRWNDEVRPRLFLGEVRRLIAKLEQASPTTSNELGSTKDGLSFRGFALYMLGEWGAAVDCRDMRMRRTEMEQPMSHYYINSSHNTYLNGNQIVAAKALPNNPCQLCECDTEMYRQVLLAGCRCIELDCWDSGNEPGWAECFALFPSSSASASSSVITHGPIMLQKINVLPFREVCEAIKDSAFKTSDYPVVLSIENHCGPEQQLKMATCFREVFGDLLLSTPLADWPLDGTTPLPPPSALRRRIILKGSKPRGVTAVAVKQTALRRAQINKAPSQSPTSSQSSLRSHRLEAMSHLNLSDDSLDSYAVDNELILTMVAETERSLMEEDEEETEPKLSDLINYFQTTSKIRHDDPSYLMHSGSEKRFNRTISLNSNQIVQHSAAHILRVYPDLSRINSTNFIPVYFWSSGCQMAALNFQTNGLPMQMNQAMFEENGACGYLLKPKCLRDPHSRMSVYDSHVLIANRLEVEIISAQFICLLSSHVGRTQWACSVAVDLYDLPLDTVRNRYRTEEVSSDGYNAFFSKRGRRFLFEKVIKPEYAMLHFRVLDEKGMEMGQRFIPVHRIQAGYRHVTLRNRANGGLSRVVGPATLFVKVDVDVYVPPCQKELRRQYVDPLRCRKDEMDMREEFADPMRALAMDRAKTPLRGLL